MTSMVIIFILLVVTLCLFLGRFTEIFINKCREKALVRTAKPIAAANPRTDAVKQAVYRAGLSG
jgi:hypothetical protein